jgi:hypothetical protein
LFEQANLNVESPNEQISVSSNSQKEESAYDIDNSSEDENVLDVVIQDTIASTKSEVHENISVDHKQDGIIKKLQVEAVLNQFNEEIDTKDTHEERAKNSEHHKNLSDKENIDNRDNIEITGTVETNLELEMMRDISVEKDNFEKEHVEKDHAEKNHVEKGHVEKDRVEIVEHIDLNESITDEQARNNDILSKNVIKSTQKPNFKIFVNREVTNDDLVKEKEQSSDIINGNQRKSENTKLLSAKDIAAMTTRKVLKKKKRSKKTHQKPTLNLPPLLQLRMPEEKKPIYYPKIKYFEGSIIDTNAKQPPVIIDNYKAGQYDDYLKEDVSVFQHNNDFASIQFGIRKELDKKLSIKNQFKSDASTMTFENNKKTCEMAMDHSSQTKTEMKDQESQCLFEIKEAHVESVRVEKVGTIPEITEEANNVPGIIEKIDIPGIIEKVDIIPEITEKEDTPEIVENVDIPEIIEKVDISEIMSIPKIEIHPPDDDLDSIDEDYEEMYTMDQILPEKKEIIIKIDFTDDEETINDDYDDYQSDDDPDSDPDEIPRQVPIPMPSESLSSKNTSLPSEPSSADESLEPTSKKVVNPKDNISNLEGCDFDSSQISCLISNLGAIPKDTTNEKSASSTKKFRRQVTLKQTVGDPSSSRTSSLPDEVSKTILDLHKQVTLKPSKNTSLPIEISFADETLEPTSKKVTTPNDDISNRTSEGCDIDSHQISGLTSNLVAIPKGTTDEKSASLIKKLHRQVTLTQTGGDQISVRTSSLPDEVSKTILDLHKQVTLKQTVGNPISNRTSSLIDEISKTILDPLKKPDTPQDAVYSSESKADIKASTKDLVETKSVRVISCTSPLDEEPESIQDPRLQQIKPHAEFNPKIDTILPSDLSDDEMSSSLEPRQEDFKQLGK